MTDTFTASNGIEIEISEHGYLLGKGDYGSGPTYATAGPEGVAALREYLQHERDTELGRWRDPETGLLVYPAGTVVINSTTEHRVVHVLDEELAMVSLVDEAEATARGLHRVETRRSAARYFAAHPEKKPWQDAKPGEVWVLETELHPEPRAFKVSSREGYATSSFTQVYNGQPLYEFQDGAITAGHRIWPTGDDDE